MVIKIANHKTIISTKAKAGLCIPKNKALHKIFKNNCWKKINTAVWIFLPFCFSFQIKYKEIPINKKSNVQTGANIQLGGLKLGFGNATYQEPMAGVVKKDPIMPAPSHKITANKNFKIFFIFKLLVNLTQHQRQFSKCFFLKTLQWFVWWLYLSNLNAIIYLFFHIQQE